VRCNDVAILDPVAYSDEQPKTPKRTYLSQIIHQMSYL